MGFVGGGSGEGSGNGVGAGSGSGPGSGSGGCGSEFMDRLECTIYTVHGLGSYSRRNPLVHRSNNATNPDSELIRERPKLCSFPLH